jgi:hypothetical protein
VRERGRICESLCDQGRRKCRCGPTRTLPALAELNLPFDSACELGKSAAEFTTHPAREYGTVNCAGCGKSRFYRSYTTLGPARIRQQVISRFRQFARNEQQPRAVVTACLPRDADMVERFAVSNPRLDSRW